MMQTVPSFVSANGKLLSLETPKIMGILNTTDDSFYANSRHKNNAAKLQIEKMIIEGAHIIDIGGISTRPGSHPIDEPTEISNTASIIKWCSNTFPEIFISIDSYRTNVIKAAIDAGVDILNDISAGMMDQSFLETVAQSKLPYIAMHMQGTPINMQELPHYEDVTVEVLDFFIAFQKQLNEKGIFQIILDPGFGFGKTITHNYTLLKNLNAFQILNLPILAGISRKGMIWKTLHTQPEQALEGTIAANTLALNKGANILRVHDVKAAADTIEIFNQYSKV